MQRDSLLPLHSLPILISTKGQDCDGFVGLKRVRIVLDAEMDSIKKIERLVDRKDCDAIVGALNGIQAYNVQDSRKVQEAYDLLVRGLVVDAKWPGESSDPIEVVPSQRGEEILSKAFPATKAHYGLPDLTNPRLEGVRIVLWWHKKPNRLSAGILCPDFTSAVFASVLLRKTGFRQCLQCGKIFRVSSKHPEQNYCTPAHRDARRIARWREKQRVKKA